MPRQLPAPPRWFVGRDAELAKLDAATAVGSGTVAIYAIGGAGGIGKTSLALRWAHHNAARFPDGQLYVNLRGFDPAGAPLRPEAVVRHFLDAFGVAPAAVPAELEGGFALYRSLAAGRRLLVVLDNARDAAQVEPLLPGSDTCTVVITSRHRLGGLGVRGAQLLDLGELAEREARELLARHLGAARVAAEPAAVDELVRWCGGLPLAISVVASRAGANPRFRLEVLARELRDTSARLDALDAGDLTTNVRAVFSWSCEALDDESARVFRLLGAAPGPDVSLEGAAALAGSPRPRAVLRGLVGAHLLQEHVPGRYRMHDLLRLYADELVGETERADAVRRFTDFLLHTARDANRLLRPERQSIELAEPSAPPAPLADRRAATAWFTAEEQNLRATLESAVARGAHEDVWRLAWGISGFHVLRGRLMEDLTAWRAGATAARALGEAHGLATALMYLGAAYTRVGSFDAALRNLREALSLAHQADLAADVQRALGWTLGQQGDFAGALDHTFAALAHYRAVGNALRQADAANTIGWYTAKLGHLAKARTWCEQALTLCREHEHHRAETVTLDSLGYIAQAMGEHETALVHYTTALALADDTGDAYDELVILANLGDTHAALGDPAAAREAWTRARALFTAHGREADAARLAEKLDA